jgi:hypothetical protein
MAFGTRSLNIPEGLVVLLALREVYMKTSSGMSLIKRYFRLRSFLESPISVKSLSAAEILPDDGAAVGRM